MEARLLDAPLPKGAEISFSTCQGAVHHAYRYELTNAGWELISIRSELSDDCDTEGGSD